jgi:pimeloyl-[acyl-carrier protein] synthase
MPSVSKQMLFLDGQAHRRAQDVMLRPLAFMVKHIPEHIRVLARKALMDVRDAGEMDFVDAFASPISLLSIAYILGIPTDDYAELRQLERWSDTFGDVTSGYFRGDLQDVKNLEEYFRLLIAKKKRAPGDDLLSAFIQAKDVFPEEDDLVANCMMVFSAGRLTSKKLLGNGISLLMPEWQQLRGAFEQNPRFPRFLGEELLRMVTPTRYLIREAGQDVDLSSRFPGKHTIRAGQTLLLFLEAANYDPDVFSQPKQLTPLRRPNKQIAFGYGPHQCPGATLARLEIQIALEEILSLPAIQPKPGTCPVWHSNPNLGGFQTNPVVFSAPFPQCPHSGVDNSSKRNEG